MFKSAPTCFWSQRIHHHGALCSTWLKLQEWCYLVRWHMLPQHRTRPLMHDANMKNQFPFKFVKKYLELRACVIFLPSPSGCTLVFQKRVKHDNRHASRKPFCRNWLDTICKRGASYFSVRHFRFAELCRKFRPFELQPCVIGQIFSDVSIDSNVLFSGSNY